MHDQSEILAPSARPPGLLQLSGQELLVTQVFNIFTVHVLGYCLTILLFSSCLGLQQLNSQELLVTQICNIIIVHVLGFDMAILLCAAVIVGCLLVCPPTLDSSSDSGPGSGTDAGSDSGSNSGSDTGADSGSDGAATF